MNHDDHSIDPAPVLLIGLGKIGFSILRLLHQIGIPTVVVTRSVPDDWEAPVRELACRFIRGDGRSEEVLLKAGVRDARAVIIATNDDLINLEILLDTRRLAPDVAIVLRLLDSRLAQRVQRDYRVRATLNAAEIATPAFVAAALGEDVLRAFEVAGESIHVVSRRLESGTRQTVADLGAEEGGAVLAIQKRSSPAQLIPDADEPVCDEDDVIFVEVRGRHRRRPPAATESIPEDPWIHPRVSPLEFMWGALRHGSGALRWVLLCLASIVTVSMVVFHFSMGLSWADSLYFTVTIVTTVGFGDIHLGQAPVWVKLYGTALMVAGVSMLFFIYGLFTDYLIRMRVEESFGQKRTALSRHLVIAGGGELGARIAERLHALGVPLLVVERDEGSATLQSLPQEIPILTGDATFQATLERAGVDRAKAVVAVTDDDMTNLRIAQVTEEINLKARTVVRLFRSRLAAKMAGSLLGVDVPLNPSEAAAATFVACALAPDVLHGFTLSGRLLLLRKIAARDRGVGDVTTCGKLREASRTVVLLKSEGPLGELKPAEEDSQITSDDWLIVLEEYRR